MQGNSIYSNRTILMDPTFVLTLVLFLLTGCQSMSTQPAERSAFVPPEGKILFIMGQDADTVNDYVSATGDRPGGVTSYTSLEMLWGSADPVDYGAGNIHLGDQIEDALFATLGYGSK